MAMGQYLLGIDGVKFLLSERFTQDPVESFFGQQRQKGSAWESKTPQCISSPIILLPFEFNDQQLLLQQVTSGRANTIRIQILWMIHLYLKDNAILRTNIIS